MRSENSRNVCAKTPCARSLLTIDWSKWTLSSALAIVRADTPSAAACFFTPSSQASKLASFWQPAASAEPAIPAARRAPITIADRVRLIVIEPKSLSLWFLDGGSCPRAPESPTQHPLDHRQDGS